MKNTTPLIAIFLLINFSGILKAQDTLYMKNGTVVPSQILQVGSTEISYKRLDNIDGPTFTNQRSEVFVIKYKNGMRDTLNKIMPVVVAPVDAHPPITYRGRYYKQGYDRLKEKEVYSILRGVNNTEINDHMKKAKLAKGMQYIGFVGIPAIGFCVGYAIYTLAQGIDGSGNGPNSSKADYAPSIVTGVVGVAALVTSGIFRSSRKKHNNAALKIYNEKY